MNVCYRLVTGDKHRSLATIVLMTLKTQPLQQHQEVLLPEDNDL